MKRLQQPVDQSVVWAAAAIAFRAQGNEYVKVGANPTLNGQPRRTNIELVRDIIEQPSAIPTWDLALGQDVRKYIGQTATTAALRGTLDIWGTVMARVSQLETITEDFDLHCIVSMPATYYRYRQREQLHERLSQCDTYAPVTGDKLIIDAEVVACRWSQKWSTYYITVVDSHNHAFYFAHRNQRKTGERFTAKGTVKRINGNQVQLNRVRIEGNLDNQKNI
jgi:hypothetical protein